MPTNQPGTAYVDWFRQQLRASGDSFDWALHHIPPHLLDQLPPEPVYLGTWQPLRLIWHVTEYERCLALPSMQAWPGMPQLAENAWPDDDEAWAAVLDRRAETLCAAFLQVRQQQIDLLDGLAGADWQVPCETAWGSRSLAWVVTKTFQHTYEHGDTLLRMGLWWEHILAEIAKYQAQKTAVV